MKDIKQNIFFIGVGGIGMSALARFFNAKNYKVAGYDREKTDLIDKLRTEGISVFFKDDPREIEQDFRSTQNTLIVYTPAIGSNNAIFKYFKSNGFECVKRAELLGTISKSMPTIAVAGTHGKTTVSTMIAYLLHEAGVKINAFLGGISRDFESNLLLNPEAEQMVVEADEFDRSFLQLHPQTAVVTSLSVDHLDSYKNEEELAEAYRNFSEQIADDGILFVNKTASEKLHSQKLKCRLVTYGGDGADFFVNNIKIKNASFYFDLKYKGGFIRDICSGMPGIQNVENAAVASALALEYGVSAEEIKASLKNFKGVQRRFDVHINRKALVYIDDYAHHPEAIELLLKSVREMYVDRKITAVFQPHLYSRTKDFADEFAAALSLADEIVLMELYPAREEAIPGIDSQFLAGKVSKKEVKVVKSDALISFLKTQKLEVLLTIGAGNIREMVPKIKRELV